jgi:hypothetical protein
VADIIDSLERLERVGSDYSKTTEKLLAAASEIEQVIVSQFRATRSAHFVTFVPPGGTSVSYEINKSKTGDWGLMRSDVRVSANRTAALKFAEHLACGLLGAITDHITVKIEETNQGILQLEAAAEKIRQQKKAEADARAEILRSQMCRK